MFLDKPSQWKELRERLLRQTVIGLDSEFYGVDFSEGQSCVNLATIDVWSVAISSGVCHPRRYHTAKGCVLPFDAIHYLHDVLVNPDIKKACHNSGVDRHAFLNAGVRVKGIVNTLSMARWIVPGRETYNLDDLSKDLLGSGKADSFQELFVRDKIELVNIPKKSKKCFCGLVGCRKRKFPHDTKIEVDIDNWVEKKTGKYIIPLYEVRPGHELWERYVKYAKVDAIRALELYDYLYRRGNDTKVEILWYENTD